MFLEVKTKFLLTGMIPNWLYYYILQWHPVLSQLVYIIGWQFVFAYHLLLGPGICQKDQISMCTEIY